MRRIMQDLGTATGLRCPSLCSALGSALRSALRSTLASSLASALGLSLALMMPAAPAPAQAANAAGHTAADAATPASGAGPRTPTAILRSIQADRFQLPAPSVALKPAAALHLWATWYYVHAARSVGKGLALQDLAGRPISPLIAARDFCLGAIEGTIRIGTPQGTTTFNLAGKAEASQVACGPHVEQKESWVADLGKTRFRRAHGPFGDGIAIDPTLPAALALVPFRSLATDPRLIASGSVLFVPAARGLKFRDVQGRRRVHDGYFLAADVGPAIVGEHVDVFAGTLGDNPFPELIFSEPGKRFEAWVIEAGTPAARALREYLLALHRP